MAIPSTFAAVKPQDFTLRPIKVHKEFHISSSILETTASGYTLLEGIYTEEGTLVGSSFAEGNPTNTVDGSYQSIIWKHIDSLYYRYPYDNSKTHEHPNRRYTFKHLTESASVLHVPYLDYGERIKEGSVSITNNDLSLTVIDDGYGNLYDSASQFDMSHIPRHNTIAYWGFNSTFRNKNNPTRFESSPNQQVISASQYNYDSYTFNATSAPSIIRNVKSVDGLEINSNPSGKALEFLATSSYVLTPDHPDLNFDSEEEFTISFWINPSESGKIISKNGVKFENRYGKLPKQKLSGGIANENHVSSSYVETTTDIYPYDFEWSGGTLTASRSDGIRTVSLTGSAASDTWTHIVLTRYTDSGTKKLRLYINGTAASTQIDTTRNTINHHALMFGARDRLSTSQYEGKLDEVRFVNRAFYTDAGAIDNTFYANIALPKYAYNTTIVGNVFYRKGCIVISPLNPDYKDLLVGDFTVTYKGTHVIYQYEVLCRIKKGDFNLSMNPSARKTPKSDELIGDFADADVGKRLRPYANAIGFYNDKDELVAVGKFGQAIQMRDDVDINILVKWDV